MEVTDMTGLAAECGVGVEREGDPGSQVRIRTEATLAEALVDVLASQGVELAFGVSGGAVALIFDALVESPSVTLHHFRHETGAAFAAAEAYFATKKPTVVFTTTGPGTLNALTGITAARWEGAKVVLLSGCTSSAQRGRWATQETSPYTMPQDALYSRGQIFDLAVRVESAAEFPEVVRRLSLGLSRPGRFIAHICTPMGLQASRVDLPARRPVASVSVPTVSDRETGDCARRLKSGSFAVWVGYGASEAGSLVRQLVERTGAKIFCSPRAKGIVSEDHPHFLGVTGLGGHDEVNEYMTLQKPDWVLVLGTRLGEATSYWDLDMVPRKGFIHVDIDPEIPGTAYPEAATIGIHSEIGCFLAALLKHFPAKPKGVMPGLVRRSAVPTLLMAPGRGPVRPQVLMQAVQRQIVQGSEALVLAECGNSFAWTNHYLRFAGPARYRVSMLFGSMGHTAAGVVGAALARRGKAVAIVGDGAMLMNSEISTAVQYQAPAVWIVLNDAGYGMCRDGHFALGLTGREVGFPRVDFVALACSVGAAGARVRTEGEIEGAIAAALEASGPFVIDVDVDTNESSPLLRRFESLIQQGNSKNVSGWEA
jgi:acetolactate synthase-1/2/3 large subunit